MNAAGLAVFFPLIIFSFGMPIIQDNPQMDSLLEEAPEAYFHFTHKSITYCFDLQQNQKVDLKVSFIHSENIFLKWNCIERAHTTNAICVFRFISIQSIGTIPWFEWFDCSIKLRVNLLAFQRMLFIINASHFSYYSKHKFEFNLDESLVWICL